MKRLLSVLIAVFLICSCACAAPRTIDLETMSPDDLLILRGEVDAAYAKATSTVVDGYTVILSYDEYARNPAAHFNELIRFNGTVLQVVEGIERNIYRIAMNGDSMSVFYVYYTPGVESLRVLENDEVTVLAEFTGLVTYETTLGSSVTIPGCIADNITEKIEVAGEYAATRKDPAPIGATIRYDGTSYYNEAVTDITVTKVIRGDAAWQMVRGFNRYNDQPSSNQEYVVAYVHAAAISSENDQQAEIDKYDFDFVSKTGMEYDMPSVAGIEPELTNLYPGAAHEGLVIGLIDKGDEPLLVYLKSADKPIWFDLNKRLPVELPEGIVLNPLKRGDKNDEVKNMQAALCEMGYLSGTPDGDFGGKTESAVIAYQTAMGIEATGVADEETLKLILTYTEP